MKNILLLSILAITSSLARDLTFAWDGSPPEDLVTEYRLYQLNEDGTTVLLDVVEDDPATAALDTPLQMQIPDFPDTVVKVFVTAYNGLESLPSNTLVVPVTPSTPGVLRVTRSPVAP